MGKEEIQEMVDILLEVGTEKYLYFKHTILLNSKTDSKVNTFFKDIFEYTDKNRPLLIEMKEGAV